MKFKKLSLFFGLVIITLSLNAAVFSAAASVNPSVLNENTVVAPSDSTTKATGADGWYSQNKNVFWAGHNLSQSSGSSLSVNIVNKNGLNAFETRVYNTSTGNYTGVAYRVSHAHVEGQPNYTAELEEKGIHEFGFEVTYFDSENMAGNWLAVYNTWNNSVNNVNKPSYGHELLPLVQYEGTNSWKRYRWYKDYGEDLSAWNFYSDQSEREDFRFLSVKGEVGSSTPNTADLTVGATYIHDFTMLPKNEFEEYCKTTSESYIMAERGGVISYGMVSSASSYSKEDGAVSQKAGRFGINAAAGEEIIFYAPETDLKDEKGAVVIDCYADEETKITVTENGKIRRVTHTGGEWQTLKFLRSEITDGLYYVKANKKISIASIHLEAADEEIPAYDPEIDPDEGNDEGGEAPLVGASVITFAEPKTQTDGKNATVTYTLTSLPEGKKAVLVAAYVNPETEKILAINSSECDDVSLLTDRKISVSLPDKTAEGGVLRHYLFESLKNVAPLGNFAPAPPKLLSAETLGTSTTLKWNKTYDDYDNADDLTYGIYDSGMLKKDGICELSGTVSGLILGEEYSLSVAAEDTMEAVSNLSEEKQVVIEKPNTLIAGTQGVGTSNPQISDDGHLMFVGGVDVKGYFNAYEPSVALGLTCYKTTEKLNDAGEVIPELFTRVPFRVDPNYANTLKSKGISKVGLEITYFDSSELKGSYLDIYMSYGKTEASTKVDAYAAADYIPVTGTNTWKRYLVAFDLNGGWFAPNETNITRGNPHIEIFSAKGTTGGDRDICVGKTLIHSVTLLPIDDFNEYKEASGAYLTANEGAVVSLNLTSDIGGKYEENGVTKHAGRFGADISKNTSVSFKLEDTSLVSMEGSVVVFCYAEKETNVTLGGETLIHSGNGWQKLKFNQSPIIKNYTLTADGDISINSVRITAN